MSNSQNLNDPRTQPKNESFAGQSIPHPGLTAQMNPAPDHGEDTYSGTGRLDGRKALITGGDSGIGRAVAIAFAREGADIAINYLPEEEDDAASTAELVEAAGRRVVRLPEDIRSREACERVVQSTVDELGGVDIVVNNAAYQMAVEGLADLTDENLERTFTTNVFASFWISQAALPHLSPGATIINTTSIQGYEPAGALMPYAATKAALVSFTQSLSKELAPRGIRVNSVAPGPIWTPLIPATMPEDQIEGFGEAVPLGRAGQPAELAGAYVFLASAAASYVTGANLAVTGGGLTA